MEEDAALRDVVKKALEGKGVLAQIRASLRAAVFTVVDEHERASGVHVPNPAALDVKHDVRGRLSLQLVADFLEHWQLHQTLSILKLETDLAEGDVLPRGELESIVGGDDLAAAVEGNGETKSSGNTSAPVLHQLLRAVSHGGGRDEGNGLPPPSAFGIGSRGTVGDDGNLGGGEARLSSLSFSLGGGDLPQRLEQEHKEPEEKEDTENEQEEEWEEEEAEEEGRGVGLGAEGNVPSKVTLRNRRAGYRVVAGSSVDGETPLASSGAPPPSPPVAEAEAEEIDVGGLAAAPSPQPSSPPGRRQQPLLGERGTDDADAEGGPGMHPTASVAGEAGNGANHYDGSMDESSYHFSEDAVSAEGGAQSPRSATAAAGVTRSDLGGWRRDDEYLAAAAPAVGSVSNPPRAVGEEEGSPGYRQSEGFGDGGVSQDDSGSRLSGSGVRGHASTVNDFDDDGGGLRGGVDGDGGAGQRSPSGDAGGVIEDEYDWDGDEEGGHGEEEDDDYEDDDDFHGDDEVAPTEDGVGDEGEDVLFEAQGSEGSLDEEAERVAALEWEARIGLSAENSVDVGLGEDDDDALDREAYDEVEDAQSVS